MTCEQARLQLLEGDLDDPQLAAHAAGCTTCRADLERLRRAEQELKAMIIAYDRVDTFPRAWDRATATPVWQRSLFAGLLALAAVATLWLAVAGPSVEPPPPGPAAPGPEQHPTPPPTGTTLQLHTTSDEADPPVVEPQTDAEAQEPEVERFNAIITSKRIAVGTRIRVDGSMVVPMPGRVKWPAGERVVEVLDDSTPCGSTSPRQRARTSPG